MKYDLIELEKLSTIYRGGSPRPITNFIQKSGTPWVKISDARNDERFIHQTKEFIKSEGESKSRIVFPGDLIISNSATPGLPRIMTIRACIHDGWLLFRDLDGSRLDKNFLLYRLKADREHLVSQGNGSIFTNLKTEILKKHKIPLPPIQEQKAIAEVLSSLDDKIELLQKQNETLEALAQTLFRQWFIEEAEDSWEEVSLTEIASFLNGLACQKYPPLNDEDKLPVLKIRDLKDGISDASDRASSKVDSKYLVNNGDVIFSWSASLVVKIWDGELCVLNQHLFKVTSEKYPKWFYYQWCKYHLNRFIAVANAHATTMGHIKRTDLNNAMVVIPKEQDLERMSPIVEPLMDKIQLNNEQIRTVEIMRDTLLPKLMSGQVSVKLD